MGGERPDAERAILDLHAAQRVEPLQPDQGADLLALAHGAAQVGTAGIGHRQFGIGHRRDRLADVRRRDHRKGRDIPVGGGDQPGLGNFIHARFGLS